MKIATIKTLVRVTGWEPSLESPKPGAEAFNDALAYAKRRNILIHDDGRCYAPYQRFVKRSLRADPKHAG